MLAAQMLGATWIKVLSYMLLTIPNYLIINHPAVLPGTVRMMGYLTTIHRLWRTWCKWRAIKEVCPKIASMSSDWRARRSGGARCCKHGHMWWQAVSQSASRLSKLTDSSTCLRGTSCERTTRGGSTEREFLDKKFPPGSSGNSPGPLYALLSQYCEINPCSEYMCWNRKSSSDSNVN